MQQNYRTTDPITSKLAGTKVTANGKRETNVKRAVAIVKQFPGHTAPELASIAAFTDMDRYEFSRRLSDGRAQELVHDCGKANKRECRITGNPSLTWYEV